MVKAAATAPGVKDSFLNRVDDFLPSRTLTHIMRHGLPMESQEPPFRSSQCLMNRVGLVAGDATADTLARYGQMMRLGPDRAPGAVPWKSLDVLLVAAEILPHGTPWRRAFLDLRGEAESLCALMAAARVAGVPVVLWLAEEAVAAPMFAHLFDAADHILCERDACAPALPVAAGKATAVSPFVDVKTFNPLHAKLRMRTSQEHFVGFLLDGAHEIGMAMGPEEAVAYFSPLFKRNWWLTDSSFDLRNSDHKVHAIMRRRFMGSMRGTDLANPLRLAAAYFLPAALAEARPAHMTRRARQAAASKTLVVTDAAETSLPHVHCAPDAAALGAFADWVLSDRLARESAQHLAWRDTLTHHTAFEFLGTVCEAAGVEPRFRLPPEPRVNIVVPTVRPDLIPYILETVRRQVHGNVTLNIVVNGMQVPTDARALVEETDFAALHMMPSHKSIGYCINYGIDQAEAEYWAKFDDDDIYGPHYLSDMLLQRKYVDIDITGKASLFTYFEAVDRLAVRRLANRDITFDVVGGGTILARPELGPFPEDVRGYADVFYLATLLEAGHRIISGDPFNFIQVRRADPTSHTWTAGAQQLDLRGPQRDGLDFSHVII
ncbi:MAG: glycosyltransferase family A protein [Pseudomonadota bacterium]